MTDPEHCHRCRPMPADPDHPDEPGSRRHLLEAHHHAARHDASDEWVTVPVRAVMVDCLGPRVELGPWSFTEDEARLLGASLVLLADAVTESEVPR